MNAADWLLLLAILALIPTLATVIRVPRPWPQAIVPLFALSLLTSELAWLFLGLQVLVVGALVLAGALDHGAGVVGLLLFALNWAALVHLMRVSQQSDGVYRAALQSALGPDFHRRIPPERYALVRRHVDRAEWMRPFRMVRPGVERLEDISYGDAGARNLLDIYRPHAPRDGGCPVLLQVHGGAWYMGHKQQQALPLLYHMAQRGWLCVSINYRLSPAHAFPAHIIDVKKAIAWVRDQIVHYGGNPDFVAITGGSAGGHLTALAALSANDPAYQPGFEGADTTVQAAVPMYGVYDFLDQSGENHHEVLRELLQQKIMGCSPQQDYQLWHQASPISRVRTDAPPMFVVHGCNDVMTSPEEAAIFVRRLREVSQNPVPFAELPLAQHAFDIFHSVRTDYLCNHVSAFLEWAHAAHASAGDH